MTPTLRLTGEASADALLSESPLALLIGMLLDQQVPMETAFAGPAKIRERMGSLDAAAIAGAEPAAFVELCKQSPAVHRFPGSMAARIQSLCTAIVDDWNGEAAAIWQRDDPDGPEVLRRLRTLPGFGEQKAKIFLALLGKQCELDAEGWEQAAGEYGEPGSARSIADVRDAESLARVRETKRAMKAAAKKS